MGAFDNLKADEAKAKLWLQSNKTIAIACAVCVVIGFIVGKLA
jgi:hypothetical protein